MVWYEGSGTGNKRFLHANHQGSIVAVTDSAGAVVGTNAYGPYGIPAQTHLGRFLYTGQIFIPEVGLYHYKARAYSPTLGRFLQTDPVGYDDQMNLYAYVANDPVNNVDPTGRESATSVLNLTPGGFQYGTPEGEADIASLADGMQRGIEMGVAVGATSTGAAPIIKAGITLATARAGFALTRRALASAELRSAAGLRRTMNGAITSIRNIIKNNGKLGDFLGASRESKGVETGFDHVTEMKNSITGLKRASDSLDGSLKNPNLSPEIRTTLEGWKKAADTAIEQMERMLK